MMLCRVTLALVGLVLALSIGATSVQAAAAPAPAGSRSASACDALQDFTYADFSDVSDFQLNGDALQSGNVMRLAPVAFNQRGTAFRYTPLILAPDTSLFARFTFQIGGSADGADGLTFILQSQSPFALGSSGEGMGYEGLAPSLAVELDNYRNGLRSRRQTTWASIFRAA